MVNLFGLFSRLQPMTPKRLDPLDGAATGKIPAGLGSRAAPHRLNLNTKHSEVACFEVGLR